MQRTKMVRASVVGMTATLAFMAPLASAPAAHAVVITPIRAVVGDEDYLLKACVGNLSSAKLAGKHDFADIRTSLHANKIIYCGPDA